MVLRACIAAAPSATMSRRPTSLNYIQLQTRSALRRGCRSKPQILEFLRYIFAADSMRSCENFRYFPQQFYLKARTSVMPLDIIRAEDRL